MGAPDLCSKGSRNPKHGCRGTVTGRFALIAFVAFPSAWLTVLWGSFWCTQSTVEMPLKGTVWRVFPLIALIALGAFFHSTPGSAHKSSRKRQFVLLSRQSSETGRIRFRMARFQAPDSVIFEALTEGDNSVSSSQPTIRVTKRTHRFFAELTEFAPELSEAK